MKRAALVLCGGRSKRMGRAKAWLPWFGQTMVEHVVSPLAPLVDEVVVVTAADLDLPPLDARIVRDREDALGPLAGLRDGLAVVESDLVFVTGTDAPEIPPRYLEELFARKGACAPISEGHVQVLSAVYPAPAAAVDAVLGADVPRAMTGTRCTSRRASGPRSRTCCTPRRERLAGACGQRRSLSNAFAFCSPPLESMGALGQTDFMLRYTTAKRYSGKKKKKTKVKD